MRAVNNGAEPRSIPFFDAVEAYLALIENLRLQVFPGLSNMYMLMSGAVPTVELDTDHVESLLEEKLISKPDVRFAQMAIRMNIENYLDVLTIGILTRLDVIATLPEPERSSWVSLDQTRRSYYNPSPRAAQIFEDLIAFGRNDRVVIGSKNTIGPQALEFGNEVDRVIGCAGTISHNPRCDDIIRDLLAARGAILSKGCSSDEDFKAVHLPLLRIYLGISRLLFGAVSVGSALSRTSVLSQKIRDIRISDSTLAIIPAPTLALLESYAEADAGPISAKGCRYLANLTTYYTTDVVPRN